MSRSEIANREHTKLSDMLIYLNYTKFTTTTTTIAYENGNILKAGCGEKKVMFSKCHFRENQLPKKCDCFQLLGAKCEELSFFWCASTSLIIKVYLRLVLRQQWKKFDGIFKSNICAT